MRAPPLCKNAHGSSQANPVLVQVDAGGAASAGAAGGVRQRLHLLTTIVAPRLPALEAEGPVYT